MRKSRSKDSGGVVATPPITEDQAAYGPGRQRIDPVTGKPIGDYPAAMPTSDEDITSGIPNRRELGDVVSDWKTPYVSSSVEYPFLWGDRVVPREIDGAEEEFGLDIYDKMLTEPILAGAVRVLKIVTLADPLAVTPSHTKPDKDEATEPEAWADYRKSLEIAEYVGYVLERLGRIDRPISQTLWNALDCTFKGHKLAEMTADIIEGGRWDGKMGLASFRCKPRENYVFVLQTGTNEFRGVIAKVPGGSIALRSGLTCDISYLSNAIAPEKLVVFTMDDRDADPRGRSWFRDPYDPWYRKQQAKVVELKGLIRFSGGQVAVICPAEDKAVVYINTVTGKKDTLMNCCITAAALMGQGKASAFPNGTTLEFPGPPAGSASYFDSFMARMDREMVLAYLLSVRSILEAKHSSKADTGTSQDLLDELKMAVRGRLCEILTLKVFRWLVTCSWDAETADKFCPIASMQKASRPDFAANATAVGALIAAMAGNSEIVFTPEQVQYLLVEILGMPAGSAASLDVDDTGDDNDSGDGSTGEPVAPTVAGARKEVAAMGAAGFRDGGVRASARQARTRRATYNGRGFDHRRQTRQAAEDRA